VDPARPEPLWYFGYGSNVCRAIFRERRQMTPLGFCPGWLGDHRLTFDIPVGPGERGVANVEPSLGARTWGGLYLLTPGDCDRLDRTEGVHVGVYRRVPVDVAAGRGLRVRAFTYRSSLTAPGRKASPRYLGLLLDGAREHGLPDEWVRFLEGLELARDEREAS
jgi:cation transport regulator ChaC